MNITATHHIVNDRTAGSMPVWQGRKVANVQSQSVEKLAAVEPGRKDAVVAEESVLIQNTSKSTYRSSMAVPKEHFEKYAHLDTQEPDVGFADFLDVINPLQHIPLVSHMYRQATGDEIKPFAQIAGGGLFGGVVGLASSAANVMIEAQTGDDLAGHVMAAVSGKAKAVSEPVIVASHMDASRYNS